MKKKLIYIAGILSASAAILSCAKESTEWILPSTSLIVSATSEGVGGPVKAQMAYRYDVLWEIGDKIVVEGKSGSDTFTLFDGEKTSLGKFRQDGSQVTFSGEVKAYYPSSIYNDGELTWPSVQTTAAMVPMMCEKNIDEGDAELFRFKSLGSVLQIVFSTSSSGVVLNRIRLKDEDKALSGKFTVSNGVAVMAPGNSGVELGLGTDGVAVGLAAKTFNIAIPAGKYENFKLTFSAADGRTCEMVSTTLPEIKPNTVTKVTLAGVFKTKEAPDISKYKPVPAGPGYKTATMWIEFMSNKERLTHATQRKQILDDIQNAGFNSIVLDIRPVSGNVLYKTEYATDPGNDKRDVVYIPTMPQIGNLTFDSWQNNFGGDFVKWFVDECHRRGMSITLSASIMAIGNYNSSDSYKGPAYLEMGGQNKVVNGTRFADMCAWEWLSGSSGSSNIANNHKAGSYAFMSPTNPRVKQYVMTMVKEIVTKYKPDGLALDYLRYQNLYSDTRGAGVGDIPSGGTSAEAFIKYMNDTYGKTVTNYPFCAFQWTGTGYTNYERGTYYREWIEFRSAQIQAYVKDIQEAVRAIDPDCEIQYWADAYPKYEQGQNWGNKDVNYRHSMDSDLWRSDNYYKTGFANYLDVFFLGAYRAYVTKAEAEAKGETALTASVEGCIENAKLAITDACDIYGSYEVNNNKTYEFIRDAAYMCMDKTKGLMVFDLSHFYDVGAAACRNPFDAVKEGIVMWRYYNGETDLN